MRPVRHFGQHHIRPPALHLERRRMAQQVGIRPPDQAQRHPRAGVEQRPGRGDRIALERIEERLAQFRIIGDHHPPIAFDILPRHLLGPAAGRDIGESGHHARQFRGQFLGRLRRRIAAEIVENLHQPTMLDHRPDVVQRQPQHPAPRNTGKPQPDQPAPRRPQHRRLRHPQMVEQLHRIRGLARDGIGRRAGEGTGPAAAIVHPDQPHPGQIRGDIVEVPPRSRQPGQRQNRQSLAFVPIGDPCAVIGREIPDLCHLSPLACASTPLP